ncbi:MAG: hypothetical protein ACJAS1_003835, partial [Oleiphilaceae bacterium]
MNKAFKINLHTKTVLALAISLSFIAPTQAADFTIVSGQTETTPQTLANANDEGAIEAGGELNTSATAITASANNNSVTNKGSISTQLTDAHGIDSTGANATISNQGSISTDGADAYGIFSQGINATISNQGSISTEGSGAYGILSFDYNATISNQGSISTEGSDAYGILSLATDATISNQGSISTQLTGAHGIVSFATGATISNQGSISTVESGAIGIVSFTTGANATISNQGSISTDGADAYGIFSQGINATISNQGSISTDGADAYGIFSQGSDATINNSGLISATGPSAYPSAYAIVGGSNNITLNVLAGSNIIGAIDLGSTIDNDTANVYGGSASANLTFENTENINLFGAGVRSGNNVITVDTTGESTRGVALASMTSSIHNVIGQRMAQTTPLKPVQVAALSLSPGMYFEEHKPAAWAQVFGGTF